VRRNVSSHVTAWSQGKTSEVLLGGHARFTRHFPMHTYIYTHTHAHIYVCMHACTHYRVVENAECLWKEDLRQSIYLLLKTPGKTVKSSRHFLFLTLNTNKTVISLPWTSIFSRQLGGLCGHPAETAIVFTQRLLGHRYLRHVVLAGREGECCGGHCGERRCWSLWARYMLSSRCFWIRQCSDIPVFSKGVNHSMLKVTLDPI